MEVDPMIIILALWQMIVSILMVFGGWMVNRIFKLTDDLRKEDELIKADMANNYVKRDDHQRSQAQIIEFLRRIEDKVDTKQDKP